MMVMKTMKTILLLSLFEWETASLKKATRDHDMKGGRKQRTRRMMMKKREGKCLWVLG